MPERTISVPEGYEVVLVPVGWRMKAMWNAEANDAQLRVDVIDGLLLADRLLVQKGGDDAA